MGLQNGYTVLNNRTLNKLLARMKTSKADGYFRQGSYSTDIIWQERRFVIPNKSKAASNNMWIFKSVINDVRKWISEHNIKEKQAYPVNYWNPKNKSFRGKVTATDLDHAYWRIAFLHEYISMKTYLRGLEVKDKSIRLAALANLSSSKEYCLIKQGEITEETVVLKYDPILHKVYSNIRYTCYEHMMNVSKLLGDEFICYKTDCIYYKDKPANRKIVQDYLDENVIEWKQLVEPQKPKKESQ